MLERERESERPGRRVDCGWPAVCQEGGNRQRPSENGLKELMVGTYSEVGKSVSYTNGLSEAEHLSLIFPEVYLWMDYIVQPQKDKLYPIK